jgi:CubicO group peptidase (beta-lactamase class C family)
VVGIVLEEGFLPDLDQRMIDFFPEYDVAELDSRKREITIRHLIQMTAGYPFDGTAEFFDAATSSQDWMRFCVIDWPLERDPGEGWAYSNASTHLLSGIVTKASGMSLLELANRYLFGRMCQPIEHWPADPQGYNWGIGYADCTPLQLASFGQMVLDKGVWRGRRILGSDWLAASLAAISETPGETSSEYYENSHYGYLWWYAEVGGREVSYASGYGGQLIVLVPSLDLVVVTTAHDFGDDFSDLPEQTEGAIMDLIATEIIPAAE